MTVDKRVIRTDRALKNAFRDLAKTTSYQELTVKKLTETAGINRKTFYLHYDSIEDFMNTFVDELSDELLRLITVHPFTNDEAGHGEIFDSLFNLFSQSREFFTFILTSDEYSFLSRKVENKVAVGFSEAIEKSFSISHDEAFICASFMIRNVTMLFRMYDRGQVGLTKQEFKDYLVRLDHSGLQTFLK